MTSRAVDLYFVYQFLRQITTPFTETQAYKNGIIDENGERTDKKLTSEDKKYYTHFHKLVFNIKKLLHRVPGMHDHKLKNLASALFLIREESSLYSAEDVIALAEDIGGCTIMEEIATSIGGGAMDNTVAPVDPEDQPSFGRCKVFRVGSDMFHQCRQKKPHERYRKVINDTDPQFEEIRQYAYKNPGKSILLQDENTRAYTILKFGKKKWW